MTDYVPISLMPYFIKAFDILTVNNKKGHVAPRTDMFVGKKSQINADKAALVQRLFNQMSSGRRQFLRKDFAKLCKGVNDVAQKSINLAMGQARAAINEAARADAAASIGNPAADLQMIDDMQGRTKKRPSNLVAREVDKATVPKLSSKNNANKPVVASCIYGLPHDPSARTWNVHRRLMLYPVRIVVHFHPDDGYTGGVVGEFMAYLPYGVLLHHSVAVVEYESLSGSTLETYLVFRGIDRKVGKHPEIGGPFAEACTVGLFTRMEGHAKADLDNFEVMSASLRLGWLNDGESLEHVWEPPRAFSDAFLTLKGRGKTLILNPDSVLDNARVAWKWYVMSTGVYSEPGTYSVKFSSPSEFRATLTNVQMTSYLAANSIVRRNVQPSSIPFNAVSSPGRAVLERPVAGRGLSHDFVCFYGQRQLSWEPLSDGICLLSDDVTGLLVVPVKFNDQGKLSDAQSDDLQTIRPTFHRNRSQVGWFTVYRCRVRGLTAYCFIPTREVKTFTSIYSVSATTLVNRVNELIETYSYLSDDVKDELRMMLTQDTERAYREFTRDSAAASALVSYGLNIYNDMFGPQARSFLRSMTPDFTGTLMSGSNFMREAILRTSNEKLAITALVATGTGVVVHGLTRDLSLITQFHPALGAPFAYALRGALEEFWLGSISYVNPAVGLALRASVASIEFARDVSAGVTPYSAALHSVAAFMPPAISGFAHVLYNGARGYIESHGTGQASLTPKQSIVALTLAVAAVWLAKTWWSPSEPPRDWATQGNVAAQESLEYEEEGPLLSALYRPVEAPEPQAPPQPVIRPEPGYVGRPTESARALGVEVAIAAVTLPWKPLLTKQQTGDSVHVKCERAKSFNETIRDFGTRLSSTWLCWGGVRTALPFHFENSAVNLIGGVFRRLLVPAMRLEEDGRTPIPWVRSPNEKRLDWVTDLMTRSKTLYEVSPQFYYESWVNSRTITQRSKFSDSDLKGDVIQILDRARSQTSYKVKFFVKQEPTHNPSIRLIFPIEPLAELAISPFVRVFEHQTAACMRARVRNPVNRQSIFVGGMNSLEKGEAWATASAHFGVNYAVAVDCTSWDSFVPGDLLAMYREEYPDCIREVVYRQLIRPNSYEYEGSDFYIRAKRHTTSQLSGAPDTYLLNSIVNAHIIENFLNTWRIDGQTLICGDDSIMAIRSMRIQEVCDALVVHFRSYGLEAKVSYSLISDGNAEFCSGYFYPVKIRSGQGLFVNSFAWMPCPYKFLSKAFLIKTTSEDDVDQALERYLMVAHHLFKYSMTLWRTVIPPRYWARVYRDWQVGREDALPTDYEFILKHGAPTRNEDWCHSEFDVGAEKYPELLAMSFNGGIFEHDSFFVIPQAAVLFNCRTRHSLIPDCRAKYVKNVLPFYEPVPAVYQGNLDYASLLAANPVFQLAVAESTPEMIRARETLERSPYHRTMLEMEGTRHLKLHMCSRDPADLFLQINSCLIPASFVNPRYYLEGVTRLGATVGEYTERRKGAAPAPVIESFDELVTAAETRDGAATERPRKPAKQTAVPSKKPDVRDRKEIAKGKRSSVPSEPGPGKSDEKKIGSKPEGKKVDQSVGASPPSRQSKKSNSKSEEGGAPGGSGTMGTLAPSPYIRMEQNASSKQQLAKVAEGIVGPREGKPIGHNQGIDVKVWETLDCVKAVRPFKVDGKTPNGIHHAKFVGQLEKFCLRVIESSANYDRVTTARPKRLNELKRALSMVVDEESLLSYYSTHRKIPGVNTAVDKAKKMESVAWARKRTPGAAVTEEERLRLKERTEAISDLGKDIEIALTTRVEAKGISQRAGSPSRVRVPQNKPTVTYVIRSPNAFTAKRAYSDANPGQLQNFLNPQQPSNEPGPSPTEGNSDA